MRCSIAGDELRRWGLPHRPKNPAEPLPNLSPTPLNSPLPRRTRQRPQRGRVGEGVASEIPSAMQLDELPPLTPQPPAPPQSMRPSPWGTRGGVTGGTRSISDRTPFTYTMSAQVYVNHPPPTTRTTSPSCKKLPLRSTKRAPSGSPSRTTTRSPRRSPSTSACRCTRLSSSTSTTKS